MTETTSRDQRRSGDKASLSPRRPYRETADVVAGLARQIRAAGRRVAAEDPEDLAHLQVLQAALDEAFGCAITGLRGSGYSDGAIGRQLRVTKQAVAQRWPRNTNRRTTQ